MIRLWARPHHPLAREIAVVLAIKVLALAALYIAFFGPSHRPDVTPQAVDRVILGATPEPDIAKPALLTGARPVAPRRNDHHV